MDNGTLITLISIGVTGLFLLGVPIFLVIGFWVVGCSLVIDFTLANVGVTLFEGLSFFGLLALPLFILTGDLINAAGIAKRMSDFAYSILGWVRGGLGMATIGACGMFAAISGSNAGTTVLSARSCSLKWKTTNTISDSRQQQWQPEGRSESSFLPALSLSCTVFCSICRSVICSSEACFRAF